MRISLFAVAALTACGTPDVDGNVQLEESPVDQMAPPPSFGQAGTCPGSMTFSVTDATPFSQFAVLYGAPGADPIPGGPCVGTPSRLANPALVGIFAADAFGSWVQTAQVDPQYCGQTAQVLDVTSCTTSNPITVGQTGQGTLYNIGGRSSDWTTSNYFRGHRFTNANGGVLESFDVYLGLASACDLDFYVHESPTGTAPWTTLWSDTVNASGTAYHNSGPVGLSMTPGMSYGVGVAWNCSATYYGISGGSFPGDYGIGTYLGSFWDNAYPGWSSNYAPPNQGTGSTAYDHNYYVIP